MNIADFYAYLIRMRRDLWNCLESVPDEILAKSVIPGKRFHAIKDLVFHVADVEDGWLQLDIRSEPPVQERFPELAARKDGPNFSDIPLATLLAYWREVEKSTEHYLERLTSDELRRHVDVPEASDEPIPVEHLLWHVMQHEVRHTAQIVLLLRQQGIEPPSLDLLFYLPID